MNYGMMRKGFDRGLLNICRFRMVPVPAVVGFRRYASSKLNEKPQVGHEKESPFNNTNSSNTNSANANVNAALHMKNETPLQDIYDIPLKDNPDSPLKDNPDSQMNSPAKQSPPLTTPNSNTLPSNSNLSPMDSYLQQITPTTPIRIPQYLQSKLDIQTDGRKSLKLTLKEINDLSPELIKELKIPRWVIWNAKLNVVFDVVHKIAQVFLIGMTVALGFLAMYLFYMAASGKMNDAFEKIQELEQHELEKMKRYVPPETK
ncbi:hypothetical protein ROZALSC1DRAFT_27126 [Rozella allomycis CSF55]|uniref:Uncharacterized protein n=1 Tax=Rozella allomycis (strain CSF55) TaxID=988480 RepID=A0A075AZZ9_ROZAC|nr:hypothetical protein O9G_003571 [Rozella allomycis CSF55]RKP21484.1 hypothetical protein ROZALSC1DRAFT_27126 [Rozella allomycis CSF55]|eukprot:EPZ35853.1 hypothetical protein O9G_003571 [Rozella allomycis CSF55]